MFRSNLCRSSPSTIIYTVNMKLKIGVPSVHTVNTQCQTLQCNSASLQTQTLLGAILACGLWGQWVHSAAKINSTSSDGQASTYLSKISVRSRRGTRFSEPQWALLW